MKPRVGVVSLGCAKNLVDSEVMLGILNQDCEITHQPETADVLIVNTCGFIDKAKEESVNTIIELSQHKISGKCKALIVTGCMAQKYSKELVAEIPEIDAVLGTGQVAAISQVVQQALAGEQVIDISNPTYIYDEKTPRMISTPRYSAYVKIADGCDNKCSYCVIPQLRGSYRSRSMESIITEVKRLVDGGVKEIMLIAQDTTRYGLDIYGEYKLPDLLKAIEPIPGLSWIRILYCYPNHFTDELIATIQGSSKICRYIDMPIQHANNNLLKNMNRMASKEDISVLIGKLRQEIPGIVLRTSFIVGLPGESETEFAELLDFMQEIKFDRVGVFTYSQEEGTVAATLEGQVEEDTKLKRQAAAMALQSKLSLKINNGRIGQVLEVLVEGSVPDQSELYYGRSQFDAPEVDGKVYFKSSKEQLSGKIIEVKVTDAFEYDLMGEVSGESSK